MSTTSTVHPGRSYLVHSHTFQSLRKVINNISHL